MARDEASLPVPRAAEAKVRIDQPLRRAARAVWDNRSEPSFTADVLRHGGCADCSLGSDGLYDRAQDGVHLCGLRLSGLRRWTRAGLDPSGLPDRKRLERMGRRDLERLGRLTVPLLYRRGVEQSEVLGWSDALKLAINRLEGAAGSWSLLCDDHSSSNETLFALSRLARGGGAHAIGFHGSDRAGVALDVLEESLGHSASTTSLSALQEADLVVLWGSVLDRHPVLGKLLVTARSRGTRVVAVHPDGRGAAETMLLPSRLVVGTRASRAVDRTYTLLPGESEQSYASRLLAGVLHEGATDLDYLTSRTAVLLDSGVPSLARLGVGPSGDRPAMAPVARDLVEELCNANRAVLVLGEGESCTAEQHRSLMRALTTLWLVRGWLGRPGAGILVAGAGAASQGARDLGLVDITEGSRASVRELEEAKLVYCDGDGLSNERHKGYESISGFLGVETQVHQACYLDPSMFAGEAKEVLVLPVQSRFEQTGGSTSTSLDRWVRFSPEIQGHPVGDVPAAWQLPLQLLSGLSGGAPAQLQDVVELREAMMVAQPLYGPLCDLGCPGDGFQWGGETLYGTRFATEDGRARLPWLEPPGFAVD